MKELKDSFGNNVEVGNKIAYSSERYGICVGEVIKIYKKEKTNYYYCESESDKKYIKYSIGVKVISKSIFGKFVFNEKTNDYDRVVCETYNVVLTKQDNFIVLDNFSFEKMLADTRIRQENYIKEENKK